MIDARKRFSEWLFAVIIVLAAVGCGTVHRCPWSLSHSYASDVDRVYQAIKKHSLSTQLIEKKEGRIKTRVTLKSGLVIVVNIVGPSADTTRTGVQVEHDPQRSLSDSKAISVFFWELEKDLATKEGK